MKWQHAMVALLTALGAVRASAAPAPATVRVSVDGQTRSVRVVGRPSDPEFYAPITKSLRFLWIDVRPRKAGDAEVLYQGRVVAHWPLVTARERLLELLASSELTNAQ